MILQHVRQLVHIVKKMFIIYLSLVLMKIKYYQRMQEFIKEGISNKKKFELKLNQSLKFKLACALKVQSKMDLI